MLYILPIIYFLMVYGAMYHVPKYNPELPVTENTVKEPPLTSPVKKDVPQQIPPEPRPVPNVETTISPVPAASEPLPGQTPPLNTESATKENTVKEPPLTSPVKKDTNQEIPPEPQPVSNVEIASPPAASETQTLPLNVETAAPAVPAQSESSVPQQNNGLSDVPASPGKQDSAPVVVRDIPEESAMPLPDPVEAEKTEVPEKVAE